MRRFIESDVEDLHQYLSDRKVICGLSQAFKGADADLVRHKWIAARTARSISSDHIYLAVCRPENNSVIGSLTFNLLTAEVSYWIGAKFQRQGYATEVVGVAVEQLLQNGTLRKIHAVTQRDNVGSKRVLEKTGFIFSGLELYTQGVYAETVLKYVRHSISRGVRPSQVDNSSGCDPRSGKVGQPPDSKHRAGGGNAKC